MGYIRKRKNHVRQKDQMSHDWNVKQLIRRDGMICQICLEPILHRRDVTLDHITPTSRGGTDKIENLRLAHEFCNHERGAGFFEPE